MSSSVLFFDLFFTLVTPTYTEKTNENDILHISVEDWELAAEDCHLYRRTATGKVKDCAEILNEILTKGNFKVTDDERNKILSLRLARMRHALLHIDPRILHTLTSLKESGFQLCIISNADVIDKMFWVHSPLYPLIHSALFSCDVGCVKPDPLIYKLALLQMNVAPSNAFFIGDGGADELRGAKKCGITTVLTEHLLIQGTQKRCELLKNTDYHIKMFSELLELF